MDLAIRGAQSWLSFHPDGERGFQWSLSRAEGRLEGRRFLRLQTGGGLYDACLTGARRDGEGLAFDGTLGPLRLAGRVAPEETLDRYRFRLEFTADEACEGSVEVRLDLPGADRPRFMIPGIFYRENRPAGCVRTYPRYVADGGGEDAFSSNYWAFRADRSPFPSVFAWRDRLSAAIGTTERFMRGQSGLWFRGGADEAALGLHFPYREEPARYVFFYPKDQSPEAGRFTLAPGEGFAVSFWVAVGPFDLHFYDAFLRAAVAESRPSIAAPWMPADRASALTAWGMRTWHYDDRHDVLYETCSFDGYHGKGPRQVDRPHMHVAWVSGAPYAYALLRYGWAAGDADCRAAGGRVLDKIAGGVSPAGVFWAEWTAEKGWGTGWNPHPDLVQARTVAEAAYYLLRAAREMRARGEPRPAWEEACRRNLDFALARQAATGSFGAYYDVHDGTVRVDEGAGGLMWIPALLLGAEAFGRQDYAAAARRAGEYYTRFVADEFIYGAPEDVHLTPTSEDGYNACQAYTHLYEADRDPRWLACARRAAEWMLSFRWTYNTTFPDRTILAQYGFRTYGADLASVSNHHLHNYGLCCLPELLRLWEYTGDEYYLQRAKDHLFCFRQFIAREDGDFNARRGMVSEQWFHTDWTHPKGFLLPLAHVWCAGWILYANLALREEIGEILVDLERGKVHAFEELEIEAVCGPDGGRLSVGNPWPEEIRPSLRFIGGGARTIRLAVEEKGERMPPMAGRRDMYQLRLAPGGRTVLAWHVTAEAGAACPRSQPLTGGAGRPAGVGG